MFASVANAVGFGELNPMHEINRVVSKPEIHSVSPTGGYYHAEQMNVRQNQLLYPSLQIDPFVSDID